MGFTSPHELPPRLQVESTFFLYRQSWGYHNSWMVYNGKPLKNSEDLGVTLL